MSVNEALRHILICGRSGFASQLVFEAKQEETDGLDHGEIDLTCRVFVWGGETQAEERSLPGL